MARGEKKSAKRTYEDEQQKRAGCEQIGAAYEPATTEVREEVGRDQVCGALDKAEEHVVEIFAANSRRFRFLVFQSTFVHCIFNRF